MEESLISSVTQSCLTLRPHGLQDTRLPCPSPTPGACSNSCPSSWWCHLTISSSDVPFSSCLQSFPSSDSFQWVSSLHQVAKVLELYWSKVLELYFGKTDSFPQRSFPFYLNYRRYIIENLEKEILNKPHPVDFNTEILFSVYYIHFNEHYSKSLLSLSIRKQTE